VRGGLKVSAKENGLLLLQIQIAPILTTCAPVFTSVLATGTPILTPLHAGSLGLSRRHRQHRSWHHEAQRGS
jgi:hypothetical protein